MSLSLVFPFDGFCDDVHADHKTRLPKDVMADRTIETAAAAASIATMYGDNVLKLKSYYFSS